MRLMIRLALYYGRGPVFLKYIAKQERISEKYLSQIIIPLKGKGLVNSFRGAHGGYALAKLPNQITVKEIVEILEGGLELVEQAKDSSLYTNASVCVTRDLWSRVRENILKTLEEITLKDLVKEYQNKEENTMMYNI